MAAALLFAGICGEHAVQYRAIGTADQIHAGITFRIGFCDTKFHAVVQFGDDGCEHHSVGIELHGFAV